MERISIFPFNKAYAPFVTHQNLMTDMQIVSLISPKGWSLQGDIVKTPDSAITVQSDFSKGIEDSTAVWFVEDDRIELPKEKLYAKISEAIEKRKKIIFSRYSNSDVQKEMELIIPSELRIMSDIRKLDNGYFLEKKLYDINVPILFILGDSENTDKFEVQVSLFEQFMKRGYRVSSISTRGDSDILGLHSMPSFMTELTAEDVKILKFNHFVKQLEIEERPEIIIIGIPGGVIPYNKYLHNQFGVTAFEISNAVKSDCAVLCSLYTNYSTDSFKKIKLGLSQKFGINVLFHHIAAMTKDSLKKSDIDENEFRFLTLDESFIMEKIKSFQRSDIYYALNKDDIFRMTDDIVEELSRNEAASLI